MEICNCPEQYNGTSCQNPAEGYYRYRSTMTGSHQETIEDYIGQSIPCQCNGRSNLCDIESGYCQVKLNQMESMNSNFNNLFFIQKFCANNTGGANCETCAEGYYGSPNDYGCEPCPCPTTQQNFARGCTFDHGRVRCACKPGYEGDLCDVCAKGFYESSEEFDGGCMDCECNPDGSISMECDMKTGNCLCKAGVTGRQCDKCERSKSTLRNGFCEGKPWIFIWFFSNFYLNSLL